MAEMEEVATPEEMDNRESIDHFHYDVTRAKVSCSCSKDRAQCRAIVGKCQKISILAPCRPSQDTRCFTKLCSRLLHKFKESQRGDFCFCFSINEELRRVLLTNISMENFFSKF